MNDHRTYILVRHGEIDANVEKRYAGRSDDILNAKGRTQALAAAMQLRSLKPTLLCCGPRARVKETAEIIASLIPLPLVTLLELDELIMGPWQGLTEEEVTQRFPLEWATWKVQPEKLNLENRETLYQLRERVTAALDKVRDLSGPNDVVCVVSHVAVIRMIIMILENFHLSQYPNIVVNNASPVVINLGLMDE